LLWVYVVVKVKGEKGKSLFNLVSRDKKEKRK
jgi:hypothetical protein